MYDYWSLDDYMFSDPFFYGLSKDKSSSTGGDVEKIFKINYIESAYEWVQMFKALSAANTGLFRANKYPRLVLSEDEEYIAFTYQDILDAGCSVGLLSARTGVL